MVKNACQSWTRWLPISFLFKPTGMTRTSAPWCRPGATDACPTPQFRHWQTGSSGVLPKAHVRILEHRCCFRPARARV